jgi:hypothetical protein
MAKDNVSFTDHPRRQRAILAMMLAGTEWRGDSEKLIWECIPALTVYGTYDQLVAKGEIIRTAAIVNRDLPMDEDDRKRFAASLNELGGYILRLAVGAGQIEKKLAALGCRVNPENGKVSFKRKGKQKGKGKDVVRKRIWEIYLEHYQEEYQAATTKRQHAIREAIGKHLSSNIDESELSPDADAGAIIYDTIRRGETRSK